MVLGNVIIVKYLADFCLPRRKILEIFALSTFRPVCRNENCMFEFRSPNKFHAWLLVSSCLSSWELGLNLSELNKSSHLTCTRNPDWCVLFWQFHFIWKKKKKKKKKNSDSGKNMKVNFYGWFLPGLFYCRPFLSRVCFKNKTAFLFWWHFALCSIHVH